MNWTITQTKDIDLCHALRRSVFIEEQNVNEADEVDGLDRDALHFLAKVKDQPVGTARLLFLGNIAKIGRVCVLKKMRGRGLGSAIIQSCLVAARGQKSVEIARLGAQVHALNFYEKLGFKVVGPVYEDAGIPHRDRECIL
jgi:predicted GNAT family N-acyltransferase